MTHDNADATAANGTAGELVARVEAGWDASERASNMTANHWGHDGQWVNSEIIAGRQAFRALVAAHEAELARLNRDFAALRIDYALQAETVARLRAFVARVATVNPDDFFEEEHAAILSKMAADAKTLFIEVLS